MGVVIQHLDENGAPCTRHPAATQGMLGLALLGSRMPSLHHDIAAKLQTLLMALEELADLAHDRQEVKLALGGANATLTELGELLAASRELSRAPQRAPTPLKDVIAKAAARATVKVRGELPACLVEISLPSVTQSLAMVFDLAAGPLELGRTIQLSATLADGVVLVARGAPRAMDTLPANAGDVLALASFALAREGGDVRCGPGRFTIRLPLATTSP